MRRPSGSSDSRDDRREERVALLEPREDRAKVRTPHLERAEHGGAQRRVWLSERHVEDPVGKIGGPLLEVPGGVHRDDACRMQEPELG